MTIEWREGHQLRVDGGPWRDATDVEIHLRDIVTDFAQHDSWRCDHPDRYPWNPDCPCGLTDALTEAGIPMQGVPS